MAVSYRLVGEDRAAFFPLESDKSFLSGADAMQSA